MEPHHTPKPTRGHRVKGVKAGCVHATNGGHNLSDREDGGNFGWFNIHIYRVVRGRWGSQSGCRSIPTVYE